MLLQKSNPAITVHGSLHHNLSEAAAYRLAAGVMKVRRDANPRRQHAVTFTHLGKLNPIEATHIDDMASCFATLANETSNCDSPCILGLAESGIIPSFAMHRASLANGRCSRWFCTSRNDQGGLKFCEPHSHAPHHFIPPELFSLEIEELWIVEDEITTGYTLNNLLQCIRRNPRILRTRVFTILDTRDATEPATVQSILKIGSEFWRTDDFDAIPGHFYEGPRQLVAGESIARALPSLMCGDLPRLQHVTLSPWMIDGRHILSRRELMPGYFLYNDWDCSGV